MLVGSSIPTARDKVLVWHQLLPHLAFGQQVNLFEPSLVCVTVAAHDCRDVHVREFRFFQDSSSRSGLDEKESHETVKEEFVITARPKNNLIVNFIPQAMDEGKLRHLFAPYGLLESVKLVKDRDSRE